MVWKGKKIMYIYGAGTVGSRLWDVLDQYGLQKSVKGYIDKEKEYSPSGTKVFRLDEVKNNTDERIVIAIESKKTAIEIYRILIKIGFRDIDWFSKIKPVRNDFQIDQLISCSKWEFGVLPQVEMHIMDSCNLNCRGCSHFSPIFPKEIPSFKRRIDDVIKLKTKIQTIEKFYILGGEPFLNPEIVRYVKEIRRILPESELYIVTNGLLLLKTPAETLKVIRDNKFKISISEYIPTHDMIEQIKCRLNENDVMYEIRDVSQKYEFNLPLTISENTRHEELCISMDCVTIWNGSISRCPTLMYINVFNEYFDQKLPDSGIISLDGDLNGWDLIDELNKRVPLCCHCIRNQITWQSCGVKPVLSDFAVLD